MEERAKQLIVYVYSYLKAYFEELVFEGDKIQISYLTISVKSDLDQIYFIVTDNNANLEILSLVYFGNLHPLLTCIKTVCFFKLKYKDNA